MKEWLIVAVQPLLGPNPLVLKLAGLWRPGPGRGAGGIGILAVGGVVVGVVCRHFVVFCCCWSADFRDFLFSID